MAGLGPNTVMLLREGGMEVLLDVDDSAIFAVGLLARRFGHRLCDCAQGALFFGNYCFGFTYIQLVD